MARLRRAHKVSLGAVGFLLLVIAIGLIMLTQTDWGRRHVLAVGLDQLESRVHGTVKIGNLRGNLLSGVRLENVVITDTAGRPFLRADTLDMRYSMRSLVRKHLALRDVHLINGMVVIDQPPGEEWNFKRIFPTGKPVPNRGPGFGAWIQLENLTFTRTTFVVRANRTPSESLTGKEREKAIKLALAPTNRLWIVPVKGGYQSISEFLNVNGVVPLLRAADPDSVNRLIVIDSLTMVALPFRPPAALVRKLSARALITKDSLLLENVRIVLPGTRAGGVGAYALDGSGARIQLTVPEASFEDARFLRPDAPAGHGSLKVAYTSRGTRTHIIASEMDVRVESGTMKGVIDFTRGNGPFRIGPSDFSFANLTTRLVKQFVPIAPLPTPGLLTGDMRLTGDAASMRLDGNIAYTERGGPTSHIVADGEIGQRGTDLIATGLKLRFNPLYLSLVRKYAPNVPYRGAVTGLATLTGSTNSGFMLNADLVDIDPSAGRSHLWADGRIESRNGLTARNLRLRFEPLQVAMLRAFVPRIPYGGTISGTTTLTGSTRAGFSVVGDITHVDPRYGRSRVGATGRISWLGGLAADHLKLRFQPVQMTLAKPYVKDLPYGGIVTGTTTLTGSQRRGFNVVADLVHNSTETGRSHVTANGWVGIMNGMTARALRLGFEPLQVAMLKPFAPTLPLDGMLAGGATVTGSMASKRIAATLDLDHHGSTGNSHVMGRANTNWGGRGSFDVDLRAPVLSLATVGRFAPSAGLRGQGAGDIVARGTLANLTTDLNLAVADGNGTVHARGAFDLKSAVKRYDFTSTFAAFNGAAVTTHLPPTKLTGTVTARGAGTSAATADAMISANLFGTRAAGSPLVDTAVVQARLANGLITFDRGQVRVGSARADISGSFGLIASQVGTLRYAIAVDTITQFMARIPADTLVITPRPLVQSRRIAQARADSARIAANTEVQRAAVGYPPLPELMPDTMPHLRRDTLAGSLRAEGTLSGNIKRFDAKGNAAARNFIAGSNRIGKGNASYTLTGFGTPNASLHLDAFGDTVYFAGFAFDSARAKVDYTGQKNRGAGSADIAVYQDPQRDYRARSDFTLSLDQKRLGLQSLALRFDTTQWTSAHPATIGWGKPGVTIANLELRSNAGGLMRVDGLLPTNGNADLRLDIEKLQLGDITALLQDTANIKGILSLHARVQGDAAAPSITGTGSLVQATFRGSQLPDINTTLTYANKDLTAHTEFMRGATSLGIADAHLPINLALRGVIGPRLIRGIPLQLDLKMDSLPLDAVPSFTTAVSDVRGRVRGHVTVRGTFAKPDINGTASLDLGSLRVNASGVRYHDILGSIRLKGDTAYVDSVVAYAGGSVRAKGILTFETLARPGFNLDVVAENAVLLDNQRGMIRADAELQVKGPYTGVHVTGDANVKSGVVYAPESKPQHVTNLQDPTLLATVDTAGLGLDILPPPNVLMQNLQVDVGLRIEPDTWARNTQANVEIYTPDDDEPMRIHMDNAHQVLTITGVINTDRGEYSVAGKNFQLSTGSVVFLGTPKIDPLLQLSAKYQVQRKGLEALIIEVHIDGSMSKPRVTLQSNAQPPLAQSDLLSYLAFGQASSSVLSLQSSSGLGLGNGGLTGITALAQQQLASVAFGATMDQIVAEVQRQGSRSGLDVFRVHAGELPAELAFESYLQNFLRGTEIEAGKYLRPRLFFEARGRISTVPGFSLQYRSPRGIIWSGTWEPRYMPAEPSFESALRAARKRPLGVLMQWNRRF